MNHDTVTLIVTVTLFITIAVHLSSIPPPVNLNLFQVTIKIVLTVIIFTMPSTLPNADNARAHNGHMLEKLLCKMTEATRPV